MDVAKARLGPSDRRDLDAYEDLHIPQYEGCAALPLADQFASFVSNATHGVEFLTYCRLRWDVLRATPASTTETARCRRGTGARH